MFLSADCSAVPSLPRRRSAAVNSHCLQEQWNILSQQTSPDVWTLLTIYSLPSLYSPCSVEIRGVYSAGAADMWMPEEEFQKIQTLNAFRQHLSTG